MNRKQLISNDTQHALETIELLPKQCEQAWKEAAKIEFPNAYKEVTAIVVSGMGASWIGADIVQNVFKSTLTLPLHVVHTYHLPAFVGASTLFIASSYSGTTEETISTLSEALERKACALTISSGGTLSELARQKKLPHYTFNPEFNPAKSPRLGLGYSLTALLAILSQLGFIKVTNEDMHMVINHLKMRTAELMPESVGNPAQKLAQALKDFIPIVVAGPFLLGNAHLFSNQFNETAKSFATYMQIPELNHHLMEGLNHPEGVSRLKFLFLESDLHDERIQKRIQVTKEVVEKNKIGYEVYKPQGTSRLLQAFDTVLFGSFVTYYLAALYKENPTPNPWVDYFKKRLKEI